MRISTRVKELLDALAFVEWASENSMAEAMCPFCEGLQPYPGLMQGSIGHSDDCEWKRLMAKWGRR